MIVTYTPYPKASDIILITPASLEIVSLVVIWLSLNLTTELILARMLAGFNSIYLRENKSF